MNTTFTQKSVNLTATSGRPTVVEQVTVHFAEPVSAASVCLQGLSVAGEGSNTIRNFNLSVSDETLSADKQTFTFNVTFSVRTTGDNSGTAKASYLIIGLGAT